METRTTDAEQLIDRVRDAWFGVPYPGDENLVTSRSLDDDGILDYFPGTTWAGQSPAALRAHSSAIGTFFSPQAYHYWLPAYLIAAVTDSDELSQGAESLVRSFLPEMSPDHAARMALLTAEQRKAALAVLEHLMEKERWASSPCCGDEMRAVTYLQAITNDA